MGKERKTVDKGGPPATDPNTKAPNGEGLPQVPDNPPVYMIQEYGNPLKQFCPGNLCQ